MKEDPFAKLRLLVGAELNAPFKFIEGAFKPGLVGYWIEACECRFFCDHVVIGLDWLRENDPEAFAQYVAERLRGKKNGK